MKFSHVFHFRKNSKNRNRFGKFDPATSQPKGGITVLAQLVPVNPNNKRKDAPSMLVWGTAWCDGRDYYNRREGYKRALKGIVDGSCVTTQNVDYKTGKVIAEEIAEIVKDSDAFAWQFEVLNTKKCPVLNEHLPGKSLVSVLGDMVKEDQLKQETRERTKNAVRAMDEAMGKLKKNSLKK